LHDWPFCAVYSQAMVKTHGFDLIRIRPASFWTHLDCPS